MDSSNQPQKDEVHAAPNEERRQQQATQPVKRALTSDEYETAYATTRPKRKKRPTKHAVRVTNLIVQGALLFVGLGYSWFAWQQWTVMNKQLQMSRLDQRAWVAPVELSLVEVPQNGKPVNTHIIFKNAGKTFAKKVTVKIFGEGHPLDEPYRNLCEGIEDRYIGDQGTVGILSPNAESHSRQRSENLTEDQFGNLMSGKMVYHVYGRVTYEDVFGCAHWTNFSSSLNVINWNYEAEHEGNDADDNTCQ